jgi:acyl-coenzyme A synthetase/AMP-(fatty) acid ligase
MSMCIQVVASYYRGLRSLRCCAGHSYITYGPLLTGTHSVLFEGVPTYPGPDRLWQIVEKHKCTTLYTAPTAIRALMVHGSEPVKKHDLSSLRILGSVGEPINPEAWRWYHSTVGGGKCVSDIYHFCGVYLYSCQFPMQ